MKGTAGKTEKLLLAVTAAFLLLVSALFLRTRAVRQSAAWTVETQYRASASQVAPVSAAKCNINTAPAEELERLPGIGEVLAGRIVEYRALHGDFSAIEEIQDVSGIGPAKFSALADEITVEEEAP